ncbi:MAG: hypothetical protein WBQ95_11090 [Terracidiphilus sp.]
MSIFEYRKPATGKPPRNQLGVLRETLNRLNAEPLETQQIADLKRILAGKINELERKIA